MPRWTSSNLAIALFTVCLLADCAYSSPSQPVSSQAVQLNEPFTLAAGQTAILEEVLLRITFDDVLSDTRCPIDVVCVDAGSVAINVSISLRGQATQSLTLTQDGSADAKRAGYHGYELALERVDPDQRSGVTIPLGDYRATLRVTQQP